MLYVDYNFDLNDNSILLDSELKLKSQDNQNAWGNLPDTWQEGDIFKLMTSVNGRVSLIRVNK
jgi:hypothetical protein